MPAKISSSTTRVHLNLDEAEWQRLSFLAKEISTTPSNIVRDLIHNLLLKEESLREKIKATNLPKPSAQTLMRI